MIRKTKIVCTLGPATDAPGVMERLVEHGMNVCRLNLSHGCYEEHAARIQRVRDLRDKTGMPLALLLDTKGPEIRLGIFPDGPVILNAGQEFTLTTRDVPCDRTIAHVSHEGLPGDVKEGTEILIDDGLVALQVQAIEGADIRCRVVNGGRISDHKGVNVPGANISLPSITDQDRRDIAFGIEQGVDFVAASFIRQAGDVLQVRKLLEGAPAIQIISKIETRQGVEHIEEILQVSDGIMVARGDLGVEIPIEDMPLTQKRIIRLCNLASKPVITATQMLDSMIRNPRPTRAETNDVANSIIDGTDAIMLSGETAVGSYPLEAVMMMDRIARQAECAAPARPELAESLGLSVAGAVSHACCDMAQDLHAAAIVTPTFIGATARLVARHRPCCPIIAPTVAEQAFHQLSLIWGVVPLMTDIQSDTDGMIESVVQKMLKTGHAREGDVLIITAGVPMGVSGTTNLIKVHVVGDILARGLGIGDAAVYGRVCQVTSLTDTLSRFHDGDILVAANLEPMHLPLIRQAGALITQQGDPTCYAAIVGLALEKPVVLQVTDALQQLTEGGEVTVNPRSGYIYKGHVKTM